MAYECGLVAGNGYVASAGIAEAEKPICAALMQKCCENLMEVLCLLLTKNGLDIMNSQLLGVCCMPVRSLVSLLLHLEAVGKVTAYRADLTVCGIRDYNLLRRQLLCWSFHICETHRFAISTTLPLAPMTLM